MQANTTIKAENCDHMRMVTHTPRWAEGRSSESPADWPRPRSCVTHQPPTQPGRYRGAVTARKREKKRLALPQPSGMACGVHLVQLNVGKDPTEQLMAKAMD